MAHSEAVHSARFVHDVVELGLAIARCLALPICFSALAMNSPLHLRSFLVGEGGRASASAVIDLSLIDPLMPSFIPTLLSKI